MQREHRLSVCVSLAQFPSDTRFQLALAGYVYRDSECVCPQCGVSINLESIDTNAEYPSNHFRKLHRKKVAFLGKRCSFLLCEAGTNIDDLHPSPPAQQQPQWTDAEEPDFANYTARLQSFASWTGLPHVSSDGAQQTFVTPQTMAKHGFFASGLVYRR